MTTVTGSVGTGGAAGTGAAPSSVDARWAWTGIGLALAMAAVAIWTGRIVSTQFADSYATIPPHQRTFPVPVRTLDLSVQDGTVVVERGSAATAVVTTSGTRTVREPTDHESLAGQTLRIRSACGASTANADHCWRNYVVRVPKDASVVAAVGTGSLEVVGLGGRVRASAVTGGVLVNRTTGSVQVTVRTGSILASGVRGPLSLHSANGSVDVNGATTRVALSSGTGSLTAVDLTGATASATTATGGVMLAFGSPPQHVTATSETGDVTVVVPPGGPSYHLELSSRTGAVASSVTSDPASSRTLRAATVSGDVDVTSGRGPFVDRQPAKPDLPHFVLPSG